MGVPIVGDGSGGEPGVTGSGTGGSSGVFGSSDSGFGVTGLSTATGGDGVHGTSASGDGVHGINGAGSGTKPKFGCGVQGESAHGYGVYGASKTASGVYGTSGPDHLAGEFVGNVSVTGALSTFALTASIATVGAELNVNGNTVMAGNVIVSGIIMANDVMITPGSDCAEDFDIANAELLEPGTVVVFNSEGAIGQSTESYDKRVAGVISGAGKYRPGIILGRNGQSREGKAPVALVGRVYCKVDADASPIAVGDLLTTSDTPGHAMKVTNTLKGLGSVVGKALGMLDTGRGLLPVLIALQ